MFPESTTAIMTIFLPCLRAAKGLTFRSGVVILDAVNTQGERHFSNDVGDLAAFGAFEGEGVGVGLLSVFGRVSGRLERGGGKGASGTMSNKFVSSCNVGIGVVRELKWGVRESPSQMVKR